MYYITKAETILPVDFDRATSSKLGFVKRFRLRPEFTLNFDKKLNPDAFIDFGNSKQKDMSDFELGEAHKVLVTKKFKSLLNDLDSFNYVPICSGDLQKLLHSHGINSRYLG